MKSEHKVGLLLLLLTLVLVCVAAFVYPAASVEHQNPLGSDAGGIIISTKNSPSRMKLPVSNGGVRDDCCCTGFGCLATNGKCCDGCYCVPIFLWAGVCVGSCC